MTVNAISEKLLMCEVEAVQKIIKINVNEEALINHHHEIKK